MHYPYICTQDLFTLGQILTSDAHMEDSNTVEASFNIPLFKALTHIANNFYGPYKDLKIHYLHLCVISTKSGSYFGSFSLNG